MDIITNGWAPRAPGLHLHPQPNHQIWYDEHARRQAYYQTKKRRLLLIGCSDTKRRTDTPICPLDLYDGPAYRVLRRYVAHHPTLLDGRPSIWMLSAKHELIGGHNWIAWYDQRMTPERARELNARTRYRLKVMTRHYKTGEPEFDEVFLMMGKDYLPALQPYDWLNGAELVWPEGGIGYKLQALSRWLHNWEDGGVPLLTPAALA